MSSRALTRCVVEQSSDSTVVLIALPHGKVTVVDADDVSRVLAVSRLWHAKKIGNVYYVRF